jgi:hypothetical protein
MLFVFIYDHIRKHLHTNSSQRVIIKDAGVHRLQNYMFILIFAAKMLGKSNKKTLKTLVVKRDKYRMPLRIHFMYEKQRTETSKLESNKNKFKTFKSRSKLRSQSSKQDSGQDLNQNVSCLSEERTHVLPEDLVLEEIRDGEHFICAIIMESGKLVFRVAADKKIRWQHITCCTVYAICIHIMRLQVQTTRVA